MQTGAKRKANKKALPLGQVSVTHSLELGVVLVVSGEHVHLVILGDLLK